MVNNFLLVGLGGAAGSILRYAVQQSFPQKFPWGTFTVNLTGSLLIGILMGSLENMQWRLLFMTGFCGGFTTFSAFSSESVLMLEEGRFGQFLLYAGGSLILGILLTIAGYKFFR